MTFIFDVLPAMLTSAVAGLGTSATVLPGMAAAPLAASTVGSALATAGTIATGLTAAGTVYSGIQRNAAAKFEAKQLKRKGEDERAIAQRRAQERTREASLLAGRARAVAGASGGTVSDPTVTTILKNIETEGEYNALAEMYRGKTDQATLLGQAKATRMEGRSALVGSMFDAGGTIYEGMARRRRYSAYEEAYG
jgi:hypothetical protein